MSVLYYVNLEQLYLKDMLAYTIIIIIILLFFILTLFILIMFNLCLIHAIQCKQN
jgi:hypothetical protein